jgi:AcrR family transcriptional regulator
MSVKKKVARSRSAGRGRGPGRPGRRAAKEGAGAGPVGGSGAAAPRGAEETKEALIGALIRLLDRKSAADVSVKEIAAEARVNHGLVHRHFGSKEALLREAVARTNAEIRKHHPDTGTTSWSLGLHRERPHLSRILARCCLDGPLDLLALAAPPPEKIETHARQARALLARFGLEGLADPYLVNALGVAAMLGWAVFRPYLEAGYKIPPDADEKMTAYAALVDLALASEGEGALPFPFGAPGG